MNHKVAIVKNTAEFVVLTPLYQREAIQFPHLNYGIHLSVQDDKPLAWVVSNEKQAAVYGPVVLKYVEILGDLE